MIDLTKLIYYYTHINILKGGGNMLSGKELMLHRVVKDITATELAIHLGIHNSYISKMERGHQGIPKHIYEKWAEFLGVGDCK
jgi:plasmid maintenance system antidote protein VapI